MKNIGLQLLSNCANLKNKEKAFVIDSGFCHGSVGVAHIFNRVYQLTKITKFKDAASFWYKETLNFAKFNNGYAGYMAYKDNWQPDLGLIQGVAGIGLSLMSATSTLAPKWDECFLLS